VIWFHCITMIM